MKQTLGLLFVRYRQSWLERSSRFWLPSFELSRCFRGRSGSCRGRMWVVHTVNWSSTYLCTSRRHYRSRWRGKQSDSRRCLQKFRCGIEARKSPSSSLSASTTSGYNLQYIRVTTSITSQTTSMVSSHKCTGKPYGKQWSSCTLHHITRGKQRLSCSPHHVHTG